MAKRPGRNQLPHCYYEGYLEKKSFKDKTSRKLWTCLCGNTLFFFNNKRESDYIEKLSLSSLISVTDDSSVDCRLDAARFNLRTKDENIRFSAPNAEARELWKGFIQSIAEMSVPTSLNLLPGQIHMLKEAVKKEKERVKNLTPAPTDSSLYIDVPADMPACFHRVSRLEAELLLDKEASRGNLLLRPASRGNFAITTRQDLNGSIFKHYRVTRKAAGGFIIDVENPVHCPTLCDLINYLVEQTNGVLIPLVTEKLYAKKISFIRSDDENGERSVQHTSPNIPPPALPPKPVSLPAQRVSERMYLNDMPDSADGEPEDFSLVLPPEIAKKPQRKSLAPPTPAPRKLSPSPPSASTLPTPGRETTLRRHTDPMGPTIVELKMKLKQQSKCLH